MDTESRREFPRFKNIVLGILQEFLEMSANDPRGGNMHGI